MNRPFVPSQEANHEIEDRIVSYLRAHRGASYLFGTLGGIQVGVPLPEELHVAISEHRVSRELVFRYALQRLRKAGRIKYIGPHWLLKD